MARMVPFVALAVLQSLLLVRAQIPGNAAATCPDKFIPYNNNCYRFYNNKLVSQASAAAECNGQDSSLLRISSQDELNWFMNASKSYPSSGYWTDLNDIPRDKGSNIGTGVWQWGAFTPADASLLQWNKIPVNDGQSNCAGVTPRGTLTDLDCSSKQGYVCSFPAPDGCPGDALGWIGESGSCYWIGNTTDPTQLKTFTAAKAYCSKLRTGASLLIIDDQGDISFLKDEFRYFSQNSVAHWVDLQYKNGIWASSNGAPSTGLITSLWAGQEPDNVDGQENCAVLRMSGRFSDRGCKTTANYICKTTQYMYSPSDNIGCGPWIRGGKYCYSFRSSGQALNWQQARQFCMQKGGDLLKLDSLDKKTWLYQQLLDPMNQRVVWTGLNNQQNNGYVWADGTPIDTNVVNWNQEPNDYLGNEDCAVIYNNGMYNDMGCSVKAAAICELDNQVSCPVGWSKNAGNCYLFTQYNNETLLYTNAEAMDYCSHFGFNKTTQGKLLSVDSKAEMTYINGVLAGLVENVYGWYTSLNDKQSEGIFIFGNSVNTDNSLIKWQGEPSTKAGDNCGMLNWSGEFHMRDCSKKLRYICERPVTGFNPNGASRMSGMGGLFAITSAFIISRLI